MKNFRRILSLVLAVIMLVVPLNVGDMQVKAQEPVGADAPKEWVKELIEPDRKPGGYLAKENGGNVKLYQPIIEDDDEYANRWHMKVLIAARDTAKTTDIVLVMDTSGSMKGARMTSAKEAANSFVDIVLKDGSQKMHVAIVPFEGSVGNVTSFTDNKPALKAAINSMRANGGTFTQGGIHEARKMLEASKADNKYMVLMSDGVPTYNYQISNANNYLIDGGPGIYVRKNEYEHQTSALIPDDKFLYDDNKTGAGDSMWYQYDYTSKRIGGSWLNPIYEDHYYYYNSGNCAIAEAGFAKNTGIHVYSIGLETKGVGSDILQKAASPSSFIEVKQVKDLEPAFKNIADNISKTVDSAKVHTEFTKGFEIPSDVKNEDLKHSNGVEFITVDGKKQWAMNSVDDVYDEDDSTLKYEYVEYVVELNNDILDAYGNVSEKIDLVESLFLQYKDPNDGNKIKEITPTGERKKVSPKIITVKKEIADNEGGTAVDNAQREFKFIVNSSDNKESHDPILLRGGETKLLEHIKKNSSYTIYESKKGKAYELKDGKETGKFKKFDVDTYYNKFEATKNNEESTTAAPTKDGVGNSVNTGIISGLSESQAIVFKNAEQSGAKAIITLEKVLEKKAAEEETQSAQLYRVPANDTKPKAKKFKIKFQKVNIDENGKVTVPTTNPKGYVWDAEVKAGKSVTNKEMRFESYKVTEDLADAKPYAPKKGEQEKIVKITLYDVLAGGDQGQKVTFTNVYDPDKKIDITATKNWVNGPEADHKKVTLKLYRQTAKENSVKELVETPAYKVVPENGTSDTFTYTWKGLDEYDKEGNLYTYTVEENGTIVGDDNKTYLSIKDEENKEKYKYEVEVKGDVEKGFTVRNTYVVPKTDEDVVAKKTWANFDGKDDKLKPEVKFELYRKVGENGTEEKVETKDLTGTEVNFGKQDKTNAVGEDYTYFVKEVFAKDDPKNANWKSEVNGLEVTNTLKTAEEVSGELQVEKKLVNEYQEAFALRSAAEPIKFKVEITDEYGNKHEKEIKANETVTFDKLYYGKYTIKETVTHGYTPSYDKEELTVTENQSEAPKFVVTNKNTGADTTVVKKTVEKVWENGPKPDTVVELWRRNNVEGEKKVDEKVDEFTANATTTSKEFKNLARHDKNGYEFEYYAKEPTVPENYESEVDGLKVKNIYKVPRNGEFTATKVWEGEDKVTRPTMKFTLHRKADKVDEVVEGAEVKEITGTNTTATWTGLEETDTNGNKYEFYVTEAFANPDEVTNQNWVLGKYDSKAKSITNKVIEEPKNPDKPDPKTEKVAKLTIKKVLVNELPKNTASMITLMRAPKSEALKFKFKVTGPYDYLEEFELEAGGEKVLDKLYYGDYKVEETDSKGYTAEYSVEEGKVTLTNTNTQATVTVTNKNTGADATVVKKTVEKVWENGPKPDTVVELWRRNNVEGEKKVDEKVDEFTANATTTSKEFTNLARHDKNGYEFEYYAKEPTVPENYESEVDGLKVKNIYKVPRNGEFTATKVWEGEDKVTRPTMKFTLHRKADKVDEVVEGAEVKEITGTNTTATWTGLEETDTNGNKYEFYVTEAFANPDEVTNQNWVLGKYDSKAKSITNKVIEEPKNPDKPDPKTEKVAKLTIKKVLVNELPKNTASMITLMRAPKSEALKFKFKVTGPYDYLEEFELEAGGEKVLDKLYYGDYKVEETDSKGYTAEYSVEEGKVTLTNTNTQTTVTVTNKNTGADTTVVKKTVEKVWENGPKPDTVVELWRRNNVEGEKKVDEKVDEFTANATTTSKEFTNLARHDKNGYEFEYYAKEPTVPENYTKLEKGLTVTNTYTSPKTEELIAKKTWPAEISEDERPQVQFELYRKVGENGTEEKVVEATALTNNQVNFGKQDKTDKNGEDYTYFVKEVFAKDDSKNDNWKSEVNGLEVTNTLKAAEKVDGKLTIGEVFRNEIQTMSARTMGVERKPIDFEFKVTGPYGYEKIFTLNAGSQEVLENLYYGDYRIEETEDHDYLVDYHEGTEKGRKITKAEGHNNKTRYCVVTLKLGDNEKTVIAVNYHGNPEDPGTPDKPKPYDPEKDKNEVEITIKKVWNGELGDNDNATIELWRQGFDKDNKEINEQVKIDGEAVELLATKDNTSKKFNKLAKHDPSGRKFEYYVVEKGSKDGVVEINGKKWNISIDKKVSTDAKHITFEVTNSYEKPTPPPIPQDEERIIARKYWRNVDRWTDIPEIMFELYRRSDNEYDELVSRARLVRNDRVDFGYQEVYDRYGDMYEYYVKEVFDNAYDERDWRVYEDGLEVTNVYRGDRDDDRPHHKHNDEDSAKKEKAIEKLTHLAYIKGYPDNTVKPQGLITRAEVAAMVSRLQGYNLTNFNKPNFPDTNDVWYRPYINACVENGLMKGYPSGTFKPNAPITRAELAQMIMPIDPINTTLAPFSDILGHWAIRAINQAYANFRIIGYPDGTFRPDRPITRAEVAAMLNRKYNRVADAEAITSEHFGELRRFNDLFMNEWYYYDMLEATNSHIFYRRGGQDDLQRDYEKWLQIMTYQVN